MSGSTLQDISGNGNNATAYHLSSASGAIGQSAQFDGSSSYAYVATPAKIDLVNDLTLSVWIKTSNSSRYEAIVGKYDASGQENGFLLRTTPRGTVDVLVGGNNVGSGVRDMEDPTTINDGQWHHIAAVFRIGTGLNLYVDGQLTSTFCTRLVSSPANAPLEMGIASWPAYGNYFTGYMDQLAIYDEALWGESVRALSNRRRPIGKRGR
jgi:hypothetical protein